MRNRIAAILSALIASVGIALMIASPAAASESDRAVDVDWSDRYVKDCLDFAKVDGCVQGYGDVLWIKDNSADGYAVSLSWRDTGSTRSGTCLNTLGQAKGWGACNKNFEDGSKIQWQLGWNTANGWQHSGWYESWV
ncbi:hypothetical protein [Glycomyces algeriensis]|jgi:hypothetical protein|uniref:Secreted protein n=1 Tax=Glycomyces algeriensis TaxID=256037 RepID=A0A9W6LI47_9ACTN|nr:hypothetical protein [Glycomyces algeriensis]MDA1364576.1 hypothetical protein [Glycomyces algeriensis]MDR7350613.1 hypothetical protein [Glycomyces algeriensis]GLI43321.1 hypothetical protein GALLR39Z86_31710 [Glycomyces algeriensis]